MSAATAGAPPLVADETTARTYLEELYGSADAGYLSLAEFSDPALAQISWFPVSDLSGAARLIASAADEGRTIYAGMGLRTAQLPHGRRGGAEDVCGIPGIWGDVDYQDPLAHKRNDLPPTPSAALAIIREATPSPPSMIVDSGFGFYPLLLFREFWHFDDGDERARAAAVLRRYNQGLGAKAGDAHVDPAGDLARVLKVPGSINWKIAGDPRPVRIIHDGGPRYTVDELEEMLPQLAEETRGDPPPYAGSRGPLLPDELEEAISIFAPWHRDGARHFSGVYVAGWCGRAGFEERDAAAIVRRLSVNDSNPKDREKATRDTYKRLTDGKAVSGFYGLRHAVGMDVESLERLEALRARFHNRTQVRINTDERDRAREKAKAESAAIAAPEFPTNVLPPAVRDYVGDAAASLSAPAEMVAVPMLGFAGSVIGNRLHLVLKNSYREYPTLYIPIIAPPGSAKTPALNLAQWPLDALQNDAEQVYRERKARYEDDLEAWRQSKDYDKPTKPQLRDYFSSNLTLEALIGMFDRAPGVAIVRDEILGWVSSMDQYRAGKGSDRQEYLALWSAKTIKLDRKGAEPIYRRYPVCCVVGGIQPDLVGGLHNEAQQRDGFVKRLLPLVPSTKPMPWTEETISTERYTEVLAVFQALDRLAPADLASGGGTAVGIGVELSTEAKRLYVAWFNENAGLVENAEGLAAGFYSKLPAHVARFALILHALWNPNDPRVMVSAERMEDAIELGEFHRAHIGRFLVLLKAAAPSCHAGLHARLMRIMRNANQVQNDCWVSRSDIYRGLRNVMSEDLTTALTELVGGGKLEKRIDPGTTKPTEYYRIRISHYSQYPGSEGTESANSANSTNNANGRAKENGANAPDGCGKPNHCRVLGPCSHFTAHGECWAAGGAS
jgi:hypothetical protein